MMNYTLEHLKIAYNAGAKKFPFDQTLELISLLGEEGLSGLLAKPAPMTKTTGSLPASTGHHASNGANRDKGRKREASLSSRILGFLKEKGSMGAHLKDIAESIKASPGSVNGWFYGTGRKLFDTGEIKRVAPSTFSYTPAVKAE
jgi:hypothetical protein